MADNKKPTDDLLKAMEKFITTKSVVGEPVVVGDTIILPMADVSFGMGIGTFSRIRRSWGKDSTKRCFGYEGWFI